jgi:phenylpropionate dioxygenase-like ring-hydroxylating dioxygenase large terminal subunit
MRPSNAVTAAGTPGWQAHLVPDADSSHGAPTRIPTARYTSAAFLAAELAHLWTDVWQLVCRADELPAAGDYYEYVIGHQSFLLVRGEDGRVRGFHNVCPHRANLLRAGCGNTGARLRCGFHGWTFGLDGALERITDRDTFDPLDESAYNLRHVAVEEWAGWLFLHPQPSPTESLDEFLDPLPSLLARYRLEQLVPVELNLTMIVPANWKVAVESFIEVYHVHAIHPQLLPNGDDVNMRYDHWTRHSRMVRPYGVPSPRLGPPESVDIEEILESIFGPPPDDGNDGPDDPSVRAGSADGWRLFERYRDEAGNLALPHDVTVRDVLRDHYRSASLAKGVDFSDLDPDQFVDNSQFLIFPNIVVNVNPTAILLFRFLPHPSDPNVCTWDTLKFDWVTDRSAPPDRPPRREIGASESLGTLLDQDLAQIVRVQRGLRTGALDAITLSRQERRIEHFNRSVDGYLERGARARG